MSFTKSVALGAFLAATLAAGSAFAKAHEQGRGKNGTFDQGAPGSNVDFTVTNAPGADNRAGTPMPRGGR